MASGICRASANIMAMACSAVVMALPFGVFITTTPRAVADLMSTLSTPMPARPTTFSRGAASSSSLRHLGRRADRQAVVLADDAAQSAGDSPVLTSTSMPAVAEDSTAAADSLSEIRTFMSVTPPPVAVRRRAPGHGPSRATAAGRAMSAGSTVAPRPDAQARRRVAIARRCRMRRLPSPATTASFFAASACAAASSAVNQGAVIFRQIEVQRARRRRLGQEIGPVGARRPRRRWRQDWPRCGRSAPAGRRSPRPSAARPARPRRRACWAC